MTTSRLSLRKVADLNILSSSPLGPGPRGGESTADFLNLDIIGCLLVYNHTVTLRLKLGFRLALGSISPAIYVKMGGVVGGLSVSVTVVLLRSRKYS